MMASSDLVYRIEFKFNAVLLENYNVSEKMNALNGKGIARSVI